MNTPDYWYIPAYRPPLLFRLAAFVYGLARHLHVRVTRPVLPVLPTLCVGNITVGGTGKTPIVQALRTLFRDQAPVVLLRGFGGEKAGPHFVHVDDSPLAVGDEALLHAQDGPTVIAKNRLDGVRTIAQTSPDTTWIILDDGFQNRQIQAHVNLLVVDGAVGFGNGYLIPAGPLREPLRAALRRADLCVIVGDDRTGIIPKIQKYGPTLPIFTAHIVPDDTSLDHTRRYLAVAGIGRPQKFFETLANLGADVVHTVALPDHFIYHKPDVTSLFDQSRTHHATIITTEKDAVKMRALTDQPFDVLKIRAVFDRPDAVRQAMLNTMDSRHRNS